MTAKRPGFQAAKRILGSTLMAALPAFFLTYPGAARTGGPAPAANLQEASPDWEDRLTAFINKSFEAGFAPGAAVAVVQGDEVVFLRGFGYADLDAQREVRPDTIFYIASSTKSFTGMLAAVLAQQGRIDLDAPISRYHPGLRTSPKVSPDQITLRQLLTHTHGISNDGPVTFRSAYSGQQTPQLLARLLEFHQRDEKGRDFSYGNIGYNVAGLVISEEMNLSWKDLLQEMLFTPLGMKDTSAYLSRVDKSRLALPYRLNPKGLTRVDYSKADSNMHAAGGLVTTVSDLTRWLRVNLHQGRLGATQAVTRGAVQEAHKEIAPTAGRGGPFSSHHYGLGWHIADFDGETMLHHFGGFSGFHSHISFMPGREIGVAVLVNEAGPGSLLAGLIARFAYASLLQRPGVDEDFAQELERGVSRLAQFRERIAADLERRSQRPQKLPRPLEDYAGVYESGLLGRAELLLGPDGLHLRLGQVRSPVEVYDGTRHALRIEVGGRGDVAFFEFEGDGPASAVRVNGVRFERVADSNKREP